MSNVKIEDYLHLYPFCDIKITHNDKVIVTDSEGKTFFYQSGEIVKSPDPYIVMFDLHKSLFKPILRPLSDMTEEEKDERDKRGSVGWTRIFPKDSESVTTNEKIGLGVLHRQSEEVAYLLSKGFDLFGLIDAGLAINKKDVTNP